MSSSSIFISLARMHHISNLSKFRRLKRFAMQSSVSGFTGKPGILIFHGTKESNKTFLEHAKGLRYLDFRHVDTKSFTRNGDLRLADGKHGLEEVTNTSDLVVKLDLLGEKEWFRKKMGMQKGAVQIHSNILPVKVLPTRSRQMHDMYATSRQATSSCSR
ncbi:hypothetical protein HYPSUDRAFT_133107 [Hypholoma sublateritium FD-334 SS-4]|uniref:Uncharacterized protein n=1 Tax=Hypholoma sublateritium (strain FD-334 SS-4) TaxID=945553 RepID=A0A0D2Q409_HYPSF|nr:hypothetical protein HYPSUDRAFT_133107 [Hypholoma sublateritium FD-334 SS-4]